MPCTSMLVAAGLTQCNECMPQNLRLRACMLMGQMVDVCSHRHVMQQVSSWRGLRTKRIRRSLPLLLLTQCS